MSEIRVKEGESLESALRRFKRSTARSGVLAEVRKREAYEKPSVKRKKKSEAARKRKFKVSYNERLCRFALRAGLHFYFTCRRRCGGVRAPRPTSCGIVHRRAACPHAAAGRCRNHSLPL